MRDAAFRANVSARYAALRADAWSDAWAARTVDAHAAAVTPAALRTFRRWGAAYAADKVQLPPPGAADYPASLAASIASLRSWTTARLRWLDSQLLAGAAVGAPRDAPRPAAPALPAAAARGR